MISSSFFFFFRIFSFHFFLLLFDFSMERKTLHWNFSNAKIRCPNRQETRAKPFFIFKFYTYIPTYIHTVILQITFFLWHTSSRTFELAVKFDIDFLKFISFVLLFFSCYFFFCLFSCFFLFLSKVYSTYYIVVNSVCLLYFYVALLSNILLTNASIPQLVLLLLLLLLLIRACKLLFILYM